MIACLVSLVVVASPVQEEIWILNVMTVATKYSSEKYSLKLLYELIFTRKQLPKSRSGGGHYNLND